MDIMVEVTARALCVADGHDPELEVYTLKVPMYGAKGYIVAPQNAQRCKSWECYIYQARAAMEAIFKVQLERLEGRADPRLFSEWPVTMDTARN